MVTLSLQYPCLVCTRGCSRKAGNPGSRRIQGPPSGEEVLLLCGPGITLWLTQPSPQQFRLGKAPSRSPMSIIPHSNSRADCPSVALVPDTSAGSKQKRQERDPGHCGNGGAERGRSSGLHSSPPTSGKTSVGPTLSPAVSQVPREVEG